MRIQIYPGEADPGALAREGSQRVTIRALEILALDHDRLAARPVEPAGPSSRIQWTADQSGIPPRARARAGVRISRRPVPSGLATNNA